MIGRTHFLALCFLFASVTAVACGGATADCRERDDDPEGYLQAICEYLVAEGIDVSPGEPDRYQVMRVEEVEFEGKEAVVVYLDCCYMGDSAIIDRETNAVLAFRLGPQ